jgi:hypothetical protein
LLVLVSVKPVTKHFEKHDTDGWPTTTAALSINHFFIQQRAIYLWEGNNKCDAGGREGNFERIRGSPCNFLSIKKSIILWLNDENAETNGFAARQNPDAARSWPEEEVEFGVRSTAVQQGQRARDRADRLFGKAENAHG